MGFPSYFFLIYPTIIKTPTNVGVPASWQGLAAQHLCNYLRIGGRQPEVGEETDEEAEHHHVQRQIRHEAKYHTKNIKLRQFSVNMRIKDNELQSDFFVR